MLPPTHWNPMLPVVDRLYQKLCNRRNKYTTAQSREIVHRLICGEKIIIIIITGVALKSRRYGWSHCDCENFHLLQLGHDECSILYMYNCHVLYNYHNITMYFQSDIVQLERERGRGVHYTLDWQTMTIIDCDQLYYMRKGPFVCIVLYYVMYM